MQNLHRLEMPALVQLLADQTALCTKMLSMGFTEQEYKECKQAIVELQVEIESRKCAEGKEVTLKSPDIFFSAGHDSLGINQSAHGN